MNTAYAVFMILIIAATGAFAQTFVEGNITQQGDTVHFELQGQNQWVYDIKKIDGKQTQFQVSVPKLSDSTVKSLNSFSSSLVKSVQVDRNGPDGKDTLTFVVSDSNIEPFDYLTEKPSKLIIDFFKNSSAPVAAKESRQEESPKKEISSNAKLPEKKTAASSGRKPASADVLVVNDQGSGTASVAKENKFPMTFDGGDPNFERFSIKDYEIKEDSVIASQARVYLQFPMLKMPSPYFNLLQSSQPIYDVTPADNDENKQARLLQTLFEKKRYNVFLKTVDWFTKKYPDSQYLEMIKFMQADAHFAIWLESKNADDFDLAMLSYRQVLEKYPQSALVERTMMLMGFSTLERGDYLGTLRLFQNHVTKRPSSPNRDIARFALADAYEKISRFAEANQIYNEIEQDASQIRYKEQAAYLKGDVAYKKGDYATAVKDYQRAQKNYPASIAQFPNAIYNQAAALFELKDYRKSLDLYRQFLKDHPSNPDAGFAMTRVGEILEILGADDGRVRATYMETAFRYGDSPSSIVAKLRMLSDRMKTMKPKEVEKAVKDIQALADASQLPNIVQFATLMTTEGYASRKEYDKAIDLLVKYYQANPTTADTKLLTNRIVKNINQQLADKVNDGKFIQALKLHNKYADNWLKNSDRIDTKFNVARAFEQAGVYKDAENLYQDALNKIYSIKGTKAGKERNVFEKLPTEDELNLRLAMVQANMGKSANAYQSLLNIKNPEKMNDMEQIERVQLASELLEKRGELDSAIRYLTELLKEWAGIPELVAEPYLNLAQLEIKKGNVDDAITSLKKIDTLMEDSKKVSPATHEKSLELLSDIYLKRKDQKEAIASLQKLLDLYENTRPLSSYRYKLGQIYFDQGEMQKAADTWAELKNQKNEFWHKLAQEKLKSSEWNDDYKKYIKRIPAMANPSATERK